MVEQQPVGHRGSTLQVIGSSAEHTEGQPFDPVRPQQAALRQAGSSPHLSGSWQWWPQKSAFPVWAQTPAGNAAALTAQVSPESHAAPLAQPVRMHTDAPYRLTQVRPAAQSVVVVQGA